MAKVTLAVEIPACDRYHRALAWRENPVFAGACAIALILGAVVLTRIGGEADSSGRILPWLATLSFLTIVWLVSLSAKHVSPALLLGTALAIRLIFLFMPTGYDIYRYVWEGRIILEGFNPYIHPPADPLLESIRDDVWRSVGNLDATAIYPPLTEWFFAALASLGFGTFGFKIVFAGADMVLCVLLCRKFGAKSALVYAWNPLAAVSFAGGGHYDSVFMLAMVLAWFCWQDDVSIPTRTALLLGVAIALKWMALPIGLWLVFNQLDRRGLRQAFTVSLLIAMPALLSWIVLCLTTGEWTLQLTPPAFSRSARSAELIPAVADFLRNAGSIDNRWFFGLLILTWIYIAARTRDFISAVEWSFLATYVLSPMLHAWYFIWILPFAVRSRNAGVIALAASGIAYFIVNYTLSRPGGGWTFTWWQRAIIWVPFLVGFGLNAFRSWRDASSQSIVE
jgi:alpha-1,6-mannosyltransferase